MIILYSENMVIILSKTKHLNYNLKILMLWHHNLNNKVIFFNYDYFVIKNIITKLYFEFINVMVS